MTIKTKKTRLGLFVWSLTLYSHNDSEDFFIKKIAEGFIIKKKKTETFIYGLS